ncbi:MAG: putative dinucleotide-utilizing enzyme [Firmicutes bacterium]|nr:putative dinucleotide-utilizing enzyme [Bacillota bacterium]
METTSFHQVLLKYWTPPQLALIEKATIAIAGAGGLGSNCAQLLVRSGFCRFTIVDFDVVEPSNLNRQFFFASQIGMAKVSALAENLKSINPDVRIDARQNKLEPATISAIFADCNIIIEAFDRPEYKKMLVETFLPTGKLIIAASGLAGWGDSDRIRVHKIKENFYLVGDLETGISKQAPLAPCVQIAAAKQADIVLEYILGAMKGAN